MALKSSEQAVINLVINGQQAHASLRELSGAYSALYAEASKLNKAEDPKKYEELTQKVRLLKQARDDERDSILSAGEAQKGFFSDFEKGFSEIEEMAGKITVGTLIYKGVNMAIEGIKDLFNGSEQAYEEAVKSQTQLQQVLKTTGGVAGESQEQLEKYQKTLMDQTGVDDDVIAKGEEMLLTFTNIRGKIYEQALPAIIDMTAALNGGKVTMEGIQETSIKVGKALNDPVNGMNMLKKSGVMLNDQQKEQIKTMQESNNMMGAQSIILKELQKEFGGTAKAVADTDVGAMQKFETRIGNIKENIGKFLVSMKSAREEALEPFVTWLEKITTTKVSETLEQDRIALLADTAQLESSNLSHEARVKIITKLKETYPEYLGNINAEKTSNSELLPILDKVNEALVLRIAYQKKSEGLQQAISDEADALLKADKAAQNMAKSIVNIQDKLKGNGINFVIPKNLTDLQQADALIKALQGHENKGLDFDVKLAEHDIQVAKTSIQQLRDGYKEASDERTKFLNDQQRFAKQYGFNADGDDQAQAKYKKDHPVVPPTSGPTAEEQAAAQRKLEAFNKQLQDVRASANQLAEAARKGTIDDLEAQLKVIQDKYQKVIGEINKLLKDPHMTAAIRKELTGRISTLTADEKLDEGNTTAAFQRAQAEKAKKENDERLKAATGQVNNVYDEARSDLDTQENSDLNNVSEKDPRVAEQLRLNIQDQYAKKRYELEQQNLQDLKTLYQAYGKSTGELDKKIADNTIKENQRAAKKKEDDDRKYIAAKKEIDNLEMSNLQAGAQFLESVLNKKSDLYKAALVVDKAIAVARVIVNTNEAIAAFTAANAGIPLVGEALVAEFAIQAHIQEGIEIAAIIAAAAQGLSDSGKKAAKGGVFEGPSHANGGLNVYDSQTGQHVVNVEGGEPWMVLSNETRKNNGPLISQLLFNSMYRNGAAVDVAGVNNGIRASKGGLFAQSSSTGTPSFSAPQNTSANDHESRISSLERMMAHQVTINQAQAKINETPVTFNNRVYETQKAKNVQIQNNANA